MEHPNPNTPEKAEQARHERDGDPATGTVKVKVISEHPVSVGGKAHEPGATFTGPVDAVRDAVARGLLEQVEKAKR